MAILGLRTTGNFVADQRPKNWRETILRLYPNGSAPLTALTSAMKKRKVDDPEFYWWEKALPSRRMALGANIASASAPTFTVGAGALQCKAGDLILVENSGEIVMVNADPTTDTSLSVTRGFSGTTAATVTYAGAGVNPYITIIGSAFEQGSLAPTGVSFDPTKKYNYTQIFRSTLEMTRTASKTRLRTDDAVKEAKREALETLSCDLERAFFFGKKSTTTLNGKPLYTMDGIEAFIDSGNVVTANTATGCTMEQLEEYLKNIFAYGSSEKVGFGGNRALLTLQQIVRKNTSWQIQSGIKEFGMNVSRLICPFGELVLKTHPLFNQMTSGTTGSAAYYGKDATLTVLDMAELQYVTFQDDDIKYQADLQDNGLDGLKAGYIGEVSIEVHHPLAHYQIKNLAKAAKDA